MSAQWPKPQLPSGLGAGGRGKEKAPCRYLHYEVDWDAGDAGKGDDVRKDHIMRKKPYRLGIGLGPMGKGLTTVSPDDRLRHSLLYSMGEIHGAAPTAVG